MYNEWFYWIEYKDTLTLYKNRLVQVYQTASRHEVGELFTLKSDTKRYAIFWDSGVVHEVGEFQQSEFN